MKKEIKPSIIVITGAESTGKSVLTQQLGNFFICPFYPEFAREYLENSGSAYTRRDVEKIARMQKKQMDEAMNLKSAYVFFDTWMIITKVWMEVVYGEVPSWIPETIRHARVDLFLLCANDIPWIPDPLRENGGEMRHKLFEMYKANLDQFGFRYRIVTGIGDERLVNALQILRDSL
jgi:NadR type nicotinamide-nucleotide adenylyltransferase